MLKEDNEDTLAHYGVEGMRWGVRKEERASAHFNTVDSATGRKKQVSYDPKRVNITRQADGSISVTGDKRAVAAVKRQINTPTPHPDHKIARETLKKSLSTVSNKDLKATNERLNLEKSYTQLRFERSKVGQGKQHVGIILGVLGSVGTVATLYTKLAEPKNRETIKQGIKFIQKTNNKNTTAFLTNPKVYSRAANVAKLALQVVK